MRENLPKEMNFVHEASNAQRTVREFKDVRTALYIRASMCHVNSRMQLTWLLIIAKVLVADKRILVMEYIQGGRVDDLPYLSEKNIDRNKIALELSRIFSRMVYINGWFHAVSVSLKESQTEALPMAYEGSSSW